MATVDLHEPVLHGARRASFFNGRVLTAEDLRDEQLATLHRARATARATGTGVVTGLRVRAGGAPGRPSVTVTPGSAVTRIGDVLELDGEAVVRLVTEPDEQDSPAPDSPFAACTPRPFRTSGAGTYLLVVRPSEQPAGRTPRVGFGDDGVAGECGPRWTAEGLLFGLVDIDPVSVLEAAGLDPSGVDPDDRTELGRSRLRNQLAFALAGAGGAHDRIRDPLRTGDPDGLAAIRSAGRLADCDVPLCLVSWSGGASVDFVDEWAVRRPPTSADPPLGALETMLSPRRHAASRASLLQFADHLDDLLAAADAPIIDVLRPPDAAAIGERLRGVPRISSIAPSRDFTRRFGLPATAEGMLGARRTRRSLIARRHFRWLPPAGVLPVREGRHTRGVVPDEFFEGMTTAPVVHVPGAQLEALLRSAASYPPIDTSSGEAVWQYVLAENRLARSEGQQVRPVLVFATGQMPFIGDAQYDLGRYDAANRARTPDRSRA